MSEVRFLQAKAAGGTKEDDALLMRPMPAFDGNLELALSVAKRLEAIIDATPIAVGLAAPQIGVELRVAVVKPGAEAIYLIDPSIVTLSGKKDRKRESCLSVWGYAGEVERREKVLVRYLDAEQGYVERQFRSFEARVVQHEVDHLEGHLYLDHVDGPLAHADLFEGHEPTLSLEGSGDAMLTSLESGRGPDVGV